MKTELEKLQEKIENLKAIQARCDHEWMEPEYDPTREEIWEEYTYYVGVDYCIGRRPTGRYEKVDRWSRVCNKCGKKEYTKELEDVVVKTGTRPKFGK